MIRKKNKTKKDTPHIFISHASVDKKFIDAFVDLLQTGIGLNHDQVFCTSLEGLGIPKGKDFIKFLHDKIQEPFLVIMVVTPSYYESPFCLCELGAAWAMSHSSFPIICPPIEYSDLEGVLQNKQAGKIDNPTDLDSLRDRIIEGGNIKNPSPTSRWNVKRDQFLRKIKKLIPKLDGFTKISNEKYTELQDDYETALQDVEDLEEELEKAKETIKKLKKAKDKKAVTKILLENMDEWEQFKALSEDAENRLEDLPNVAIEALYYDYYGGSFSPSYFDKEWLREEVSEAHQRGYVDVDEDGEITLNDSNPRVAHAVEGIDELNNFIAQASTDFDDVFIDECKFEPNIKLRDFWEKFLGL